MFFSDSSVHDYEEARGADHDAYARFFHGMLARGIALAPGAFEAWFVSAAHTDTDVRKTVDAIGDAMKEAAALG